MSDRTKDLLITNSERRHALTERIGKAYALTTGPLMCGTSLTVLMSGAVFRIVLHELVLRSDYHFIPNRIWKYAINVSKMATAMSRRRRHSFTCGCLSR